MDSNYAERKVISRQPVSVVSVVGGTDVTIIGREYFRYT